MTDQQKSKQASANSNAKRIAWQREAIRLGAVADDQRESMRLLSDKVEKQAKTIDTLVSEVSRLIEEVKLRDEDIIAMGKHIARLAEEVKLRSCELLKARTAAAQAEAQADVWRGYYIAQLDQEVVRQAEGVVEKLMPF